jgi:hypothetical protein
MDKLHDIRVIVMRIIPSSVAGLPTRFHANVIQIEGLLWFSQFVLDTELFCHEYCAKIRS